jgi:hypothetical protein
LAKLHENDRSAIIIAYDSSLPSTGFGGPQEANSGENEPPLVVFDDNFAKK